MGMSKRERGRVAAVGGSRSLASYAAAKYRIVVACDPVTPGHHAGDDYASVMEPLMMPPPRQISP
jgi:hypothetical protein